MASITSWELRIDPDAVESLVWEKPIGYLMRDVATGLLPRVAVPPGADVQMKGGIGRTRGAFAQLIMFHPRALYIEYGTRNQPPRAPLRRAVGLL